MCAGAALLAAMAAPAFAQTQPESNGVVGPAEIRGFSLPGQRPPPEREPEPTTTPVTPPRSEPVAIPAPDAPATPAPTPAPAEPDAAAPASPTAPAVSSPAPARRQARTEEQADAPILEAGRLPSPADAREAVPTPPMTELPAPAPEARAQEAGPAEPQATTPEDGGSGWLLPLLAVLALIGGALAYLKLRRREEDAVAEPEPAVQPAPEPAPLPAPEPVAAAVAAAPEPALPAPEPAPAGHVGLTMRPWLELHFKPARATATDGGASVQYDAVIRNVGNAPARNVRLAARMFNAGPQLDQEIAGFFALDIDAPDGTPLTLLPRTEVALTSVVTMPREEMREIKVQGRSLFIPTVAFNLLYEWGRDKVGQTCSSHVVGREPEQPSEKMAPFRLDLGPRVYRQVGQRPSALARAV